VQVFDKSGNFVAKWGSQGDAEGELQKPESIEVDSDGQVYVADTTNNNVQLFIQDNSTDIQN
jgi:DNA-binding beta-propeller fold protein YncE